MTRKPKPKMDPELRRLISEDENAEKYAAKMNDEMAVIRSEVDQEHEEDAEEFWQRFVVQAVNEGNPYPALDLLLSGFWCPPLAGRALRDVVARKLNRVPGRRPAYGEEVLKKQRVLDIYDWELRKLQADLGRKRVRAHDGGTVSDQARRRAAEKLNPADPSSEVDRISELLKRRRKRKATEKSRGG